MLWSRGLAVCAAALVGIVGVVGWSLRGGAQVDNGLRTQDRRGAVNGASNVFVGQVVGEQLFCLETSSPTDLMVYDYFQVRVERNVKGRVEGTVLVWQQTDDTSQYGPDGRLLAGRKYLFITRHIEDLGVYSMVDSNLGYVRIDSPDERAELVAEVERYLADPYTPEPSRFSEEQVATWNARNTVTAATRGPIPTQHPCEPWVGETATAIAVAYDPDASFRSVSLPVEATPER